MKKKKGVISFNRKGVSPIVATVLILLITIVAASLISVFVIPFVKEGLSGGEDCFKVLGDLKFDEQPYNCNYFNNTASRTGFSVRLDDENIKGFKVTLGKDGSADPYEITDGGTDPLLTMLDPSNDFGDPLDFPSRGGVRTYVANGTFDRVNLFPILENGRLCEESDSIELVTCVGMDIINDLVAAGNG